jgi:tetratricopeptide (TPR) repeat protein
LIPLGRFDEAVEQLKRAARVDPVSPSIEASFGVVEFMRGDYANAVKRFERLLTQDDGLASVHYCMGLSAHYMGEPEQAIEALERASGRGGWSAEIQAALGGALAAAGRESEAREVLGSMIEAKDDHYVSPVRVAQLHAGLSEPEVALDRLEEALSARAADLIWIDVFPAFETVRGLPRYAEIRRAVFGA